MSEIMRGEHSAQSLAPYLSAPAAPVTSSFYHHLIRWFREESSGSLSHKCYSLSGVNSCSSKFIQQIITNSREKSSVLEGRSRSSCPSPLKVKTKMKNKKPKAMVFYRIVLFHH